jgi:rubrerythrin
MAYDDDRVQCHLCGKWFKWVGGAHLRQGHGWSLDEYREAFQLLRTTTTASPATSTLKRKRMFEQIAAGQRVPPDHEEAKRRRAKQDPTVARWRSLAAMRPDLAAELHPTRNGKLDPYALGRHSHRAVWWRGVDCGHEWQMSPNERTSAGRGCPTCGKGRSIAATIERNRQPIPPERSLAVRYPLLLAEWHPTRNGSLDPNTIAAGSERKIWWRCAECGHEWTAPANDRTRPNPHGCPECARTRHIARQAVRALSSPEKSFAALYPHLLIEWHRTRNGALDPYTVKPASERRVWWRCASCGHEWQATPGARRRSHTGGCRSCAATHAQRKRWSQGRQSVPASQQ